MQRNCILNYVSRKDLHNFCSCSKPVLVKDTLLLCTTLGWMDRTFNLLTSGSWQKTGGLWMLLSAPLLSNIAVCSPGLSMAITLCFMYATLTLTFTHIAADAQFCTLHLQILLLTGGVNQSKNKLCTF